MEEITQHPAYGPAARYCSYQERTEQEVHKKLATLGVPAEEVEPLIEVLKAQRFLNEERYVEAFIQGKWGRKQWGKRKLKMALIGKGVAPTYIQQGLDSIDETAYRQVLQELADKKRASLQAYTHAEQQQKTTNYLLQRGYEPDLVYSTVQKSLLEK